MEEARHWVWAKRKHGTMMINNINIHDHHDYDQRSRKGSYDESWEEQAFAEDAAGSLGCVWPPRSYSCSFCRREFRSAQALGGHMNVHRRDRARLKQSPPDDLHREILNNQININGHDHHHHQINIPFHHHNVSPLMITNSNDNSTNIAKIPQFPSEVCPSLLYNNPKSNPNPNPNSGDLLADDRRVVSQVSCPNSGAVDRCNLIKSHHLIKDDGNIVCEDKKVSSLGVESGELFNSRAKSRDDNHHVKTADLSVSLNLVVCRSCPSTALSSGYNMIREDCDHRDDNHSSHVSTNCKRRRVVYHEELPSEENPIRNPSSGNQDFLHRKEVVNQQSTCSKREEIDLELRLGI